MTEKKIMKAAGLTLAVFCAGLAVTVLTGKNGTVVTLAALWLFGVYCVVCGVAAADRKTGGEEGSLTRQQDAGEPAVYCYICSPYRGGFLRRIRNRRYARRLTKEAVRMGYVPITPHLYLTQVLDDRRQQEREKGLELGLHLVDLCGTILVGTRYGISAGMKKEMKRAVKNGMCMKSRR